MKARYVFLFLLLPISLLIFNIFHTPNILNYLDTPLYTIMNIIVAILFAYYFTQLQTDRRRKVDLLNDWIGKMITTLENPLMYDFVDSMTGSAFGYIEHSIISHRCELLKDYAETYNFASDLQSAEESFKRWWVIFGEVMGNRELALKHSRDLRVSLAKTISKLESIQSKLHKVI